MGFFSNEKEVIKDNEILFIPSLYDTNWSRDMNKIFSKYMFTYKKLNEEKSYLSYHKLTFNYYYNYFDNIRNNKNIKYIFFQNLFEDCDWRLFELSDKKIYGFIHSFSGISINPNERNLREEYIIEKCSGLFVASKYMKDLMIKKGYPENKIHICGFPFEKIQNNKDLKENILIFNHRLVKNKGADKFLKLIPKFLNKYKDLKIYICVPKNGNSTDILKRYNEIKNNRVIIQIDNGKNYKEILKRAKYGVSLSEFDTFGTSFSYALLNNIYYFVPKRFAFEEIANKDFIYNNIEELFEKFNKVYKQKNIYNINNYIEEFLDKFSEEKVVDKIIQVIKNGK